MFEGLHASFPLPDAFHKIPSDILLTWRIEVHQLFDVVHEDDGSSGWLAIATATSPNSERSHRFFCSEQDLSGMRYDERNDRLDLAIEPSIWKQQYRWQCGVARQRRSQVGIELEAKFDLGSEAGKRSAIMELLWRGAEGEWIGTELEDSVCNTMLSPEQIADVLEMSLVETREFLGSMLHSGEIDLWTRTFVPADWEPTAMQTSQRRFVEVMFLDASMKGPDGIDPRDLNQ